MHRAAVAGALAVVVGLAFGAPHLVIPGRLPDPSRYTPLVVSDVSFLTVDETYSYAARVRKVMDGRWFLGDPVTWEHRHAWPVYAPPEQWVLGALARALGGVPRVFVVADFVCPPLDFLLMSALIGALCGSWLIGASTAMAILAGGVQHSVALALEGARTALGGSSPMLGAIVRPLEFSRLYAPELTFVPFAGALWATWTAMNRESLRWAIVAGLCLAVLIPSYLFYWMFLSAGIAVLLAHALVRGDDRGARVLATVLATGFVVAAPYFVSYVLSAERADVSLRMGLERGRWIAPPSLKDAVLAGLVALGAWRLRSRALGFVFAFWIGYLLCRNVQLLTGFTVQSGHWGYRVGYIWQTLTIATLIVVPAAVLAPRWPRAAAVARRAVTTVAIAGFVIGPVAIAGHEVAFALNTAPAFVLPDGYPEAFDWVNRSTPPGSVIVTPSFETGMLIPVYTHANVFLANGFPSLAPTAELVERLLLTYKAFDVPAVYLAASLRDDPARAVAMKANGGRFERRRPELLERFARWYVFHRFEPPDATVADIVARYERLAPPPGAPFAPYRADYVWLSPLAASKGRLDLAAHPDWPVVYDRHGVTIAKIGGPR